jgi:WD40 repeat protein
VLLNNAEPIKFAMYSAPFALIASIFIYLYVTAEGARKNEATARKLAEMQQNVAESRGLRAEARRLIAQGSLEQAAILLRTAARPEVGKEAQNEVIRDGLFELAHGQITAILPEYQFSGSQQIVFSPSGDSIVTGSLEARLWRLPSGALGAILKALPGETSFNRALAYSPDNTRIGTGSQNGAALWSAATGSLIANLTKDNTANVAFSPDSRFFLTASQAGEVRLFDSRDGKLLEVLEKPSDLSLLISNPYHAFSPDGRKLITTFSAGAHLWDADTRKLLATLDSVSLVQETSFSRDSSRLIADGQMWDGNSGKLIRVINEGGIELSVAFSPDQRYFLTGSWNMLAAWKADSGDLINVILPHADRVLKIKFSPDGSRFITADGGGPKLWDARNFELIATLTGHSDFVLSAEFAPDSQTVVTASNDSTRLWEASTGLLEATLTEKQGLLGVARFSPDGKVIAIGGYESPARLWSVDRRLPVTRVLPNSTIPEVAAISENGQRLWYLTSGGENVFWNLETGSKISQLVGPGKKIERIAFGAPSFAKDGELFVSTEPDSATVWSVSSGKPVGTVEAKLGPYIGDKIAISGDGRFLATLSKEDHAILVWDLQSLTQVAILKGHSGDVEEVVFSPDSRLLATGSNDRTVKLWDTSNWSLFSSLDDHSNVISRIRFSPNSKRLAVGTTVGTLHVWEVDTKKSIVSRVQTDVWKIIAFSRNGRRLIASNGDRTWLWDPDDIQPSSRCGSGLNLPPTLEPRRFA